MAVSPKSSSPSGGKSPSAARLRAQRANAQHSTGPRTLEGRRRSALNRLGQRAADHSTMDWAHPPHQPEFLLIWRDLRALFWFVPPELWREQPKLEFYLQGAAAAWHSKLLATRNGFSRGPLNMQIQARLGEFVWELNLCHRKARYWCRKEFGTDGLTDIPSLRESIEGRLRTYSRMAAAAQEGAPIRSVLSNPNRHIVDSQRT